MLELKINYRGGLNYTSLIEQARELRKKQTPVETLVWEILRNRKLHGFKFRRQHQIGYYIVDFYCDELKLIIELDGEIHLKKDKRLYDLSRDVEIKSLGYQILRFKNQEILDNIDKFIETITQILPQRERD